LFSIALEYEYQNKRTSNASVQQQQLSKQKLPNILGSHGQISQGTVDLSSERVMTISRQQHELSQPLRSVTEEENTFTPNQGINDANQKLVIISAKRNADA